MKTQKPRRNSSCVWKISKELVLRLQEKLGDPLDTYVNGSQVWLQDHGDDLTIEWRLHPVGGYQRPSSLETANVFSSVVLALANNESPPVPLDQLWDGLEAFAAFDEEIEPSPLATLTTEVLGLSPDAAGLVDHKAIGDEWERSGRSSSIVDALIKQLATNS